MASDLTLGQQSTQSGTSACVQAINAGTAGGTVFILSNPPARTDDTGYHLKYTVYKSDGSVYAAEASLTSAGAAVNIPPNGSVGLYAYRRSSGGGHEYSDQVAAVDDGGGTVFRQILSFRCTGKQDFLLQVLVAGDSFTWALDVDVVVMKRATTFKPTVTLISSASTGDGVPRMSTDNETFNLTAWPQDAWTVYLRVQDATGAYTDAKLQNDTGTYATFVFRNLSGDDGSDPKVTIELQERGLGTEITSMVAQPQPSVAS